MRISCAGLNDVGTPVQPVAGDGQRASERRLAGEAGRVIELQAERRR